MASSPMWISRWEPMATRRERPTIRRKAVLLLRITAVLVVVGGLGLAWVANWPSISKACTVAASIDEVGAATPEAARIRWARQNSRDIDIEHPDRTSGSGDHVTATYILERPAADWADPDHTYLQEVVTERGNDDVWRVVSANKCTQWPSA